MVKIPPVMRETGVLSLGGEDCLENPHGQRSMMGHSLWGHKESDTAQGFKTKHNGGLSSGGGPLGWGAWYEIQNSQSCRTSAI